MGLLKMLFSNTLEIQRIANGTGITSREVVGGNRQPYWHRKGWTRFGKEYRGYYQTHQGCWAGRIAEDGGGCRFYISNPPRALKGHAKWICFHHVGGDEWEVHYNGHPDPSAGILAMENMIGESHARGSRNVDAAPVLPNVGEPVRITARTHQVAQAPTFIHARPRAPSTPAPSLSFPNPSTPIISLRRKDNGGILPIPGIDYGRPDPYERFLQQGGFGRQPNRNLGLNLGPDLRAWQSLSDRDDSE